MEPDCPGGTHEPVAVEGVLAGEVQGAIIGVMAAFTGLLAGMVLVLSRRVLPVPAAVCLAAAAFVA